MQEILGIVIVSITSILIGFAIGWSLHARHMRKNPNSPMTIAHENQSEIKSAFDIRFLMVENACQEGKEEREENQKVFTYACKLAQRNIGQINAYIIKQAKSGRCHVDIPIITSDMEDEEPNYAGLRIRIGGTKTALTSKFESVVIPKQDKYAIAGRLAALLRDVYAAHGYDTWAGTDTDWQGNVMSYVGISWDSDDFDASQLDQIEFASQVEAFKAGVPLTDILA